MPATPRRDRGRGPPGRLPERLSRLIYPTANTWWSCRGGNVSSGVFCKTDNRNLSYFDTNLSEGQRARVRETMYGSYNATDLIVRRELPVYTGDSETDIIFQSSTSGVPTGQIGTVWCDNAVTSTKCDQHYVRFNPRFSLTRAGACHEAGHAIGFVHGNRADPPIFESNPSNRCMTTPHKASNWFLGTEMISQINATY